ncbi:MAG: HEPN domain-containing protein [Nanoarchaeota archaeon]|nr:HEPN domain-containing protein [Nanoarchaeota archaeon]MBU1644676.1 HEPN domain-containing protein [Nanoarchaeota archaeon]MBU1976571.1 HEPN domain-containing protein [Nanoarchaeota archaeon]
MKEEAKKWFEQAKKDIEAAEINHKQKIYYVASLMSQQAAEKALKAFLIDKGLKIPKVHDLVFLARKADVEEYLFSKCDKLTQVYIESRYPTPGKEPFKRFDKENSKEHILIAEEILKWVEENI